MLERLECEVLQKARYINTLTFTYLYLYIVVSNFHQYLYGCLVSDSGGSTNQGFVAVCTMPYPVPDFQPTATELFQSPLYGSGTVFRSISHLLRHFPSSSALA